MLQEDVATSAQLLRSAWKEANVQALHERQRTTREAAAGADTLSRVRANRTLFRLVVKHNRWDWQLYQIALRKFCQHSATTHSVLCEKQPSPDSFLQAGEELEPQAATAPPGAGSARDPAQGARAEL